jgi:Putative auto-transporter adhesin, head GIN domain
MPKIQQPSTGRGATARVGASRRVACLLAVVCAGCVETFDGNGVPGEQVREVEGFDSIVSRGELEVVVSEGPFAVRVTIDENLLDRIEAENNGGRLEVAVFGGNLGESLPGPHVSVSMPSLLGLELSGSGRVTASEFDENENVSLRLSGSGELRWSGDAPGVAAELNGSGELTLAGEASGVDYVVTGAGALEATALRARSANIEVYGPGSVSATVDGVVDARVEGSGTIELAGNVIEGNWVVLDDGNVNGP